jgi:hypothetical protein
MAEAVKTALKSNNYRILKEKFYTGHNGGSIEEIIAVTAILPVGDIHLLMSLLHYLLILFRLQY